MKMLKLETFRKEINGEKDKFALQSAVMIAMPTAEEWYQLHIVIHQWAQINNTGDIVCLFWRLSRYETAMEQTMQIWNKEKPGKR